VTVVCKRLGSLKIAVWHNLPSGGGKRALYSQVRELVKRGHSVEAWCPETADAAYLPLSDLATEHRLPFKRRAAPPRTRWQRVHSLGQPAPDPLLQEMDSHSQTCAEAIQRGHFDLVFVAPCVHYRVPRLARFLQAARLPIILYLQEPRRWVYEALPELPWIAPLPQDIPSNIYSRSYWRFLLNDYEESSAIRIAARREVEDARLYDAILVNSHYSRESVARVFGLDARVSYLGYDAELFRHYNLPRQDFIVGVGSMDFIKGVDTAIEAVALLSNGLRLPLVWVANSGDPEYETMMIALAERRGVLFDIRRRISDRELVQLLNQCRFLLYTSRLEPFGYAAVEANACGAPVVGIAEGGVREIIVDRVNGILRERNSPELAAAIAELLTDQRAARRMGQAGAETVARSFSLSAATDSLLGHFDKALAAPRRRAVHHEIEPPVTELGVP
jgi:glycosyltransferase involved in cell wall biosynthesis